MKLPDVEEYDDEFLDDAMHELLANLVILGFLSLSVGVGLLFWYLYIY